MTPTFRARIALAAATRTIDVTGVPQYREHQDGSADTITVANEDVFTWFAVAWSHGLKVRVRLEVVRDE